MSIAPGNQAGFSETQHNGHTSCYYKCISYCQRFWQKKAMVRHAAKCRGTRVNQNRASQTCEAWRCRYNDQCPGADAACAICGAFKPPEFMPTRPATASNPAFVSSSASSASPSPDLISQPLANHDSRACSRPLYGLSESRSQWMKLVEQREALQKLENIILLPLYEDVVGRYLTDV